MVNELIDMIFLLTDYNTLSRTRKIQSNYVKNHTEFDNFYKAAENGNLNNMKWLYLNKYNWEHNYSFPSNSDSFTFDNAIIFGDFKIIKWLKLKGCPWSVTTFELAVTYSNLEIMKWLKLNGCPWNYTTFYNAIEYGDLDKIIWLHEQGCPWEDFHLINAIQDEYMSLSRIKTWYNKHGCDWNKHAFKYHTNDQGNLTMLLLHLLHIV